MSANNMDKMRQFDKLRDIPSEFTIDEMNQIINDLDGPNKHAELKNSWTDLLNFKNLIMLSIPIIIVTAILFSAQLNNTANQLVNLEESQEADEEDPRMVLKTREPPTDENTIDKSALERIKSFDQIIEPEPAFIESNENKSLRALPKTVINKKPSENKISVKPDVVEEEKMVIKENVFKGGSVIIAPSNGHLPDMGGPELKRLRKKLFKNLYADGIIDSKSISVEMVFPGNEIRVNGQIIDQELFAKYKDLTDKVGSGKDRMIKMDHEYIKVGDFTEEGFVGSGVGTFRSEFVKTSDVSNDIISTKEIIEQKLLMEKRALDKFCEGILTKQPQKKPSKNLFSVNINYNKCVDLHTELYSALLKDGIIETHQSFVFIELPKGGLIINGKELVGEQNDKYNSIISNYKIKNGNKREIRMSENTIRIGDFSKGNFTGTSSILD